MSPSSARRGQTEPLAALAAVLAVGLALSLYAGALDAARPGQSSTGTAAATLARVHDAVTEGAVVRPERLGDARDVGPDGSAVNVTLSAGGERWTAGPDAPTNGSRRHATAGEVASARRAASVRLDRWCVRPGRLRVVVWS